MDTDQLSARNETESAFAELCGEPVTVQYLNANNFVAQCSPRAIRAIRAAEIVTIVGTATTDEPNVEELFFSVDG